MPYFIVECFLYITELLRWFSAQGLIVFNTPTIYKGGLAGPISAQPFLSNPCSKI